MNEICIWIHVRANLATQPPGHPVTWPTMAIWRLVHLDAWPPGRRPGHHLGWSPKWDTTWAGHGWPWLGYGQAIWMTGSEVARRQGAHVATWPIWISVISWRAEPSIDARIESILSSGNNRMIGMPQQRTYQKKLDIISENVGYIGYIPNFRI